MNNYIEKIVKWLKNYVESAGCKGVVFGLSGGIDSAVIAGLAKKAFPDTSLGIIMPIHSMEEDEADARLVAENLNLSIEKVDLSETYDNLIKASFNSSNKMAASNIKPRLRMTTLYYYAQENNYLVVGSSNKSEFLIGYFTKHGDSGSDIMPLADFTKTEVFQMAKELNIPEKIINKKPSAGLWKGQTDEAEMGFSYETLDAYINGQEIDQTTKEVIDKKYKQTDHKRKMPLIFEKE